MAIKVGRWDCKQCGHTGNLGPNTHCTQCGGTRPKNVIFYLPENVDFITNEDKIREAMAGPDWVCSYCSSNNKVHHKFCTTCGNQHSQNEAQLEERDYSLEEVPRGKKQKYEDEAEELLKKKPGLARFLAKLGIPSGIVIAIFGFLASFSSEIMVTVDSMPWSRIIHLEEHREVEEEGWQIPASGRELDAFRAVHHHDKVSRGYETKTRTHQEQVGTRQVACGQRDLGNGYFETKYCDEPIYETRKETYEEEVFDRVPVYRTKFRYAIYRWKPSTSLEKSGDDSPATWPDDQKLYKPEEFRETRREGEYFLSIKDHKGELHEEEFPLRDWEKLKSGDQIKAEKSTIFGYYKGLVR